RTEQLLGAQIRRRQGRFLAGRVAGCGLTRSGTERTVGADTEQFDLVGSSKGLEIGGVDLDRELLLGRAGRVESERVRCVAVRTGRGHDAFSRKASVGIQQVSVNVTCGSIAPAIHAVKERRSTERAIQDVDTIARGNRSGHASDGPTGVNRVGGDGAASDYGGRIGSQELERAAIKGEVRSAHQIEGAVAVDGVFGQGSSTRSGTLGIKRRASTVGAWQELDDYGRDRRRIRRERCRCLADIGQRSVASHRIFESVPGNSVYRVGILL